MFFEGIIEASEYFWMSSESSERLQKASGCLLEVLKGLQMTSDGDRNKYKEPDVFQTSRTPSFAILTS